MTRPDWTIAMISLVGAVAAVFVGMAAWHTGTKAKEAEGITPSLLRSTVELVVRNKAQRMEHGSGFHMGNGYVITAAHVIANLKTFHNVVAFDADGGQHPVTVMWSSVEHDVAMVRIGEYENISTSELSCLPPVAGMPLRASGYPMDMGYWETLGTVAGDARTVHRFKEVTPINLAVLPGMSGGPIFSHGKVVGITVAFRNYARGRSTSWTNFSLMVPGNIICHLLARTA